MLGQKTINKKKTPQQRYSMLLISLWALLLFSIQGCSTKVPTMTKEQRSDLGKIAIVRMDQEPKIDLSDFPFAKGPTAGGGALLGLGMSVEECGGLFFICALVAVPAGAIMGTLGTEEVDSEAIEEGQKAASEKIVAGSALIVSKLSEIASDFPGHKLSSPSTDGKSLENQGESDYLKQEGFDSTLEVSLEEVQSQSINNNDLYFSIKVSASLRNNTTGEVIMSQKHRAMTARRSLDDWMTSDGVNLRNEFDFVFQTVAERILQSFFFTEYILEEQTNQLQMGDAIDYGFQFEPQILHPQSTLCSSFGYFPCHEFEKIKIIKEPNPSFRWAAFPNSYTYGRPYGRATMGRKNKNEMKSADGYAVYRHFKAVSQVSYDLRIYSWPVGFIYEETGLEDTEHDIAGSLEPCREFRWTVRARYVNGDKQYMSGWSYPQFFRTAC